MNVHPRNLSEALECYYSELEATRSPQQAQNIKNETDSALFRFVLPKLGFKREDLSRRMTNAEIEEARSLLKTLSLRFLWKLVSLSEQSFEEQQVSVAVRNTYGARIRQFHDSCAEQIWYPGSRSHSPKFQEELAPPLLRIYGRTSDTILMPEKAGVIGSLNYSLKPAETNPALQQELDEYARFLGDAHYADRVTTPIDPDTVGDYLGTVKLYLGWWHRHYDPSLPLEQLSLNLLVPKFTDEDLDQMSSSQRKRLWREQKRKLRAWISAYFQFLADVAKSRSPRTREGKLAMLLKLSYYQYRHEVEEAEEYDQIEIIGSIKAIQREYRAEAKRWNKSRQYVADQSKKWPDVPDGKTALTVLREGLFVKLWQRCRPRNSSGVLHDAHPLAQFLAIFLMWAELLLEPPRRQQEFRTRRVALVCPIQRPASVPPNGLYHPLPPDEVRMRNQNGLITDNYLYRTYERQGKHYPEGIWVKQICKYKTRKHHGVQDIIIRNRPIGDGLTLYDYIERYLYGYWYSGSFRNSITYQWWDEALQGCRGRWLSKGVMEFESEAHEVSHEKAGNWPWMLLFPVPDTGKEHTTDSLARAFEISSHEWLGKRITPHVLRAVWATWAFQIGLPDATIHSLAYAMGSTYKTLRDWYERCTPEDKRRPIEEAIDDYFFDALNQYDDEELQAASPEVQRVLRLANRLSPSDRQQLLLLLRAS
ncbi:MAG TPA: hypothetical protein V6D29_16425 [Leptolyngbyaceae cyanobacterium]